jgi:molybdopterin adenylyltransferase
VTISVGVLTVSDRCSRGEAEDVSGPLIQRLVTERLQAEVRLESVVPDVQDSIREILRDWCDKEGVDLILTTGGTGFAPRDVTPEATKSIIEREAPGLAEAMRREGAEKTPHALLSRASAGIRGRTLIVNLPGSTKAVQEGLEVILPALPHGIEILREATGADRRHAYEG